MEISLLQAFALGLLAFIAGLDMFNGLTHMHRPVVLGPLVCSAAKFFAPKRIKLCTATTERKPVIAHGAN